MSNALAQLTGLLSTTIKQAALPITDGSASMESTLAEMRQRSKGGNGKPLKDHLIEAVRRFCETQRLDDFRDTYLVSWGLTQLPAPASTCIIEDGRRFDKVLEGVDEWKSQPLRYRRCYQGLMSNYFGYDGLSSDKPAQGRKNWKELCNYLRDNNDRIMQANDPFYPEWVDVARKNCKLFDEKPCGGYAEEALYGDLDGVNYLCHVLGIGQDTWFQRELVLEQIRHASSLRDGQFISLLPRLLDLLQNREVLRDRGLALILDRYVKVSGTPLNSKLRDTSVLWWKNPWLPSNATQWGAVSSEAKTMISDWLKGEFIEAFFNLLAQDGTADQRRMKFWKKYIKAISHMEFALGATARSSHDRDFIALRKKMDGLIGRLAVADANNAFIMHMGNLVVVEFSQKGNALYGYDVRNCLPFDTRIELRLGTDRKNTLKNQNESCFRMTHSAMDWEDRVTSELANYGVHPDRAIHSAERNSAASPPAPRGRSGQYSLVALQEVVKNERLHIEDNRDKGGALWVIGAFASSDARQVLTQWGFSHREGRGWWKQ